MSREGFNELLTEVEIILSQMNTNKEVVEAC